MGVLHFEPARDKIKAIKATNFKMAYYISIFIKINK